MRNRFTKVQNYTEYKYKVKEYLEKFTFSEYTQAKQGLPKSLGVNPRTFERYLYTKQWDKYEIPANQLAALAKFFNCTMEELLNYEPKRISLLCISKREKTDLAKSLGLIK